MVQFYRPVFLAAAGQTKTTQIAGWVDPTDYTKTEPSLLGLAHKDSPFVAAIEMMISDKGRGPTKLVWAGDYYDVEYSHEANLYKLCSPDTKLYPEESDTSYYNYLVNYSSRQFVSKDRAEKYTNLHPLPILTAEGNGYGAGDYPDEHALVGYWARDKIGATNKKPAGFVEIIFDIA